MRRALLASTLLAIAAAADEPTRLLRWTELPAAIQTRLAAHRIDGASFERAQTDATTRTAARVRESDLDALVYYALQSRDFTAEPPIEPALSARAFVQRLDAESRTRFLDGAYAALDAVPEDARRRLLAFATSSSPAAEGTRLALARDILTRERGLGLDRFVRQQYVRVARFLYLKEFVAQQQPNRGAAVSALYHDRGLSTDTAVEAGYVVHSGLAALKALQPERRITRVLVVGPGFDLAPRTGLLDAAAPASYQPYAIADSLIALGLSSADSLLVLGGDVNPRVVEHLRRPSSGGSILTLLSGIGEGPDLQFDSEYRAYFDRLGGSVGAILPEPALPEAYRGHLRKAVRLRADVSRIVSGVTLDITTTTLSGAPVDLVVATNIFPYLDDTALTLAVANIARMLAPGGVLLHNEPRPLVGAIGADAGLPFEQARSERIATVRGTSPLGDSVFVHVKQGR